MQNSIIYLLKITAVSTVTTFTNFTNFRDFASSDLVTYVFKENSIDTVMHFAAQTHVDNSFGNSFAFTQAKHWGDNIMQ